MSQDTPTSDADSPALATAKSAIEKSAIEKSAIENDKPDHVYLVSYPKIVYLYPTVLAALFCGIIMWAKGGIPQEEVRHVAASDKVAPGLQEPAEFARAAFGSQGDENAATPPATESTKPETTPELQASETPNETDAAASVKIPEAEEARPAADDEAGKKTYHNVIARIFLLVMALNLVVISFDFPRTTSLTWFFAIVALVIGIWFLFFQNPWLAPRIVDALLKIKPAANASFYLIFAGLMLVLYICVLVSRRFDYWEVKGNELLHHHGFLSNLERFSAPNLRIDKEINDVFEYLLLRSGRLIIHASNERRAIVLENILFINDKEERITKMLGALQVRVRTDRE